MSYFAQDLSIIVDGVTVSLDFMSTDPLIRAVMISLFTWRRALPDDRLPHEGSPRMGWWGDSYALVTNDRIGSRLWLLSRETLTSQTLLKAKQYAEEALAWLLEDGIASNVTVTTERFGVSGLAINVTVTRTNGATLNLRFADIWKAIANA